jgi:lysylphosphatidylglycerol synthetase-like protein (DUF2156 family)
MNSNARPISPEIMSQIRTDARESLHPTWATAELEFYRSRNGILFAGVFSRSPLIIAADPIYGGDPGALAAGLDDLIRAFPFARSVAFVGVSSALLRDLPKKYALQAMQIGVEPWLDLAAYEPRGNRGRGIRSARNQALRTGVHVVRMDGEKLALARSDERARATRLLSAWKNQGFIEIGGFLQPVDLFHDAANRFYFVACNRDGEWCGLLAATRIGETRSIFLEDLILDPRAASGTGELLTLEALRAFSELGFSEASLGAVSLTRLAPHVDFPPPSAIRRGFVGFLRTARLFYNAEGIELFRKRFPVREWRPFHFAVARTDGTTPSGFDWVLAGIEILRAHRPRFAISSGRLGVLVASFLRRRSVQFACVLVVAFVVFSHFPRHAHASHHRRPWFGIAR